MMSKLIARIKKADWRAELASLWMNTKRKCLHIWYTTSAKWQAWIKGVDVYHPIAFNGPIIFDRFKHSRICIASDCVFNSHSAFNMLCTSASLLQTATDSAEINIGHRSHFSSVRMRAERGIYIGEWAIVGAGCIFRDSDEHPAELHTRPKPIHIGNHVFIGMNCMIMKGVTIGDNAIIGAGSIVTNDIPADCIAAGVPCRVIKNR